jgi:hypothetical protein
MLKKYLIFFRKIDLQCINPQNRQYVLVRSAVSHTDKNYTFFLKAIQIHRQVLLRSLLDFKKLTNLISNF